MQEEISKLSKRLSEIIDNIGNAWHLTGLTISGQVVQLRYWLRALQDAEGEEARMYLGQIGDIVEEIEDILVTPLTNAKNGSENALYNLDRLVKAAEQIIAQSAAHNVDQINDPTVRAQVWGLTGGKCAYCQIDLAPDKQGNGETHTFCVEHVVPVSYGGPNNIRNYVPSCRSCNNSKGDKHVLTFIRNNLPARLEKAELRLVANSKEPWMPERME